MKKKIFTMLMLFAFSTSLFSQQKYNSDVENTGVDCQVGLKPAFTPTSDLPDPFLRFKGQRITTKNEWWSLRNEIMSLFEENVYGVKPIPKPGSVSGTVTNNTITVNVTENGKTISFTVSVSMPDGVTGPVPAFITYYGTSSDAVIKAQGVATINYNPYVVGMEGTGRTNKSGHFYTLYGSDSKTGLLAAWAWGVSRIIDVIEQSDGSIIDASAIGVSGCSRFGKGSFAAGVLDQRIALTMPVESGTGGVPAFRTNEGQSLESAYTEQPWFGDAFGSFILDAKKCPVDMHMAVALVAPRGLLILDNPHISNLAPKAAHLSAVAGSKVYEALGVLDNISYMSNVADGSHCAHRSEWNPYIENFINRFLHRKKGVVDIPSPLINPRAGVTGKTELIAWATPELSGDLEIKNPTLECFPGFLISSIVSPAGSGTILLNPPLLPGARLEPGKVELTAVPESGWKFSRWVGDVEDTQSPVTYTTIVDADKTIEARFLPTVDGTTNFVKNGNFVNKVSWILQQGASYGGHASATWNAANGNATINITKIGEELNQPCFTQLNIPLFPGLKYHLSFTASAASARNIEVLVMQNGGGNQYASKTFALTTTPQSFMIEFEMPYINDATSQLAFNLGESLETVILSDVKLIYIAQMTGISQISNSKSNLRVSVLNAAVNVNFTAIGSGKTELRLYSATGSLIASTQLQTVAGKNYSHTFNQGNLPSGFYVVWLDSKGIIDRAKVILK